MPLNEPLTWCTSLRALRQTLEGVINAIKSSHFRKWLPKLSFSTARLYVRRCSARSPASRYSVRRPELESIGQEI
jgi:hypothetical protein